MANVDLNFSATLKDGLSSSRSMDAYLVLPDTTTLAQIAADFSTWITDLDAITDAAITAGQVRLKPSLPGGLKAAAGSTWTNSRIEQVANVRFSVAGSDHSYGHPVRGLAFAQISAGKVLLTGSMATYLALLTGGTPSYTNANRESIVAYTRSTIAFQKSRKQLGASSKQ